MNWKSFWIGVGSVFNIWGNYRINDIHIKSDKEALEDDWKAIGQDFKKAMGYESPAE